MAKLLSLGCTRSAASRACVCVRHIAAQRKYEARGSSELRRRSEGKRNSTCGGVAAALLHAQRREPRRCVRIRNVAAQRVTEASLEKELQYGSS